MHRTLHTVKLLGICGSPRKSGNSRFLLERSLASAEASLGNALEAELYSLESVGKRVVRVALLKCGGVACQGMLEGDGSYEPFLGRLASRL